MELHKRAGPKQEWHRETQWRTDLLRRCAARMKKKRQENIRARRHSSSPLGKGPYTLDETEELKQVIHTSAETEEEKALLRDAEEFEGLVDELRVCVAALAEQENAEMIAARDAEALAAEADMERLSLQAEEVFDDACLCPVCGVRLLMLNRGVVFCVCGLRLETAVTDAVTLGMVRVRLASVFHEHGERGCGGTLVFSVREFMGVKTLHATCPTCSMHAIVL